MGVIPDALRISGPLWASFKVQANKFIWAITA